MKIIDFLESPEFNQLRLNMGASLVKKIDSFFITKPLTLINSHIRELKQANEKSIIKKNNSKKKPEFIRSYDSDYLKDKSSSKIFHPIKKK